MRHLANINDWIRSRPAVVLGLVVVLGAIEQLFL